MHRRPDGVWRPAAGAVVWIAATVAVFSAAGAAAPPPAPAPGAARPDLLDLTASATLMPGEVERIGWLLAEGAGPAAAEADLAAALSGTGWVDPALPRDAVRRYLVEAARGAASDRLAMLVHLVSVHGPSKRARAEAAAAYAELLAPPAADARKAAHRARLAAWARDGDEDRWLRTAALRELTYFRDPVVVDVVTADFAAPVRDAARAHALLTRSDALRLLELVPPAAALRAACAMTGDLAAFLGSYERVEWLLDAGFPGAAGQPAVLALVADPATRAGAAAVLARYSDPAAVPPLLEVLERALRIGAPGDERERAARSTLYLLGHYKAPEVRLAAARAGAELSGDEARQAALAAMAGADDAAVALALPWLLDALRARDGMSRAMAASLLAAAPATAAAAPVQEALLRGLDRAFAGDEADAQNRVLDALLAAKVPATWPALAERLDRIGSVLDDRIRLALEAKELPGGAPTRAAVAAVLRDEAVALHPVAGVTLAATGSVDDLWYVFQKLGADARPLTWRAVDRHLAAAPGDWAKWLADPDPTRRLFALVHADLSKDAARPALIAGRLTDEDRLVRVWALVRLRPFLAPDHADELYALLEKGKAEERGQALALLVGLKEPPDVLAKAGALAVALARHDPALLDGALRLCASFPSPAQDEALVAALESRDAAWVRVRALDLLELRRDTLGAGALDALAGAFRGERDTGVAAREAKLLCTRKVHLDDVYASVGRRDTVAGEAVDCLGENGGRGDWSFVRTALRRSVSGAEATTSKVWLRVLKADGAGAAAPLLDDLTPPLAVGIFATAWEGAEPKARAALGVAAADVRATRSEALRRLGAEKLAADPAVRALATGLVSDRDVSVRLAALELLRDGGGISPEVAHDRLGDRDAAVRLVAFARLREAGEPDLADVARDFLDDDARDLRRGAAEVLRDRGAGAKDVLALAGALADEPDAYVRAALDEASRAVLARLSGSGAGGGGDADALAAVARAADDAGLRLAALGALDAAAGPGAPGGGAKKPGDVAALLDRLARKDEDARVRVAALALLEKLDAARARGVALKLVAKATTPPPARGAAAAVLGRLGDTLEELEALAVLAPAPGWSAPPGLEDVAAHRDAVAERVGTRRAGGWEGVLADAKAEGVRLLALDRLVKDGAAKHAGALVRAADRDGAAVVRRAALDALLAARHPEAERLAIEALDDDDTIDTGAAMLATVGGERALRALFEKLADEDLAPHAAALDAARAAIWGRLAPDPAKLAAWAREDGAPRLLRYEALKWLPPAALAPGGAGSGLVALRAADKDPLVRGLAYHLMEADPALAGGPGPAADLARHGLRDDREEVAVSSARLLGRFGGLDDLLLLERAERKGDTGAVRAEAHAATLAALERLLGPAGGSGAGPGGVTAARTLYDRGAPALRVLVAERVGPLSDAGARTLLLDAAGDGKPDVRRAAFARLPLLGAGTDVLGVARARLDDSEGGVAAGAAGLVAALGDGADLALLTATLDDAPATAPDRRAVLSGAFAALAERLAKTLAPASLAAAYAAALEHLRGEPAILVLRRLDTAAADEPFRRALAGRDDAVTLLSWHARKGKPSESRFLAVRLLGRAGGTAATHELLRVARGGGDEDVRVAAVEAIGASGDVAATTELLALAGESVPDRVRAAAFSASLALRGTAGADPVAAVAPLGEALDRGDPKVAAFAVDELDKLAIASAAARPAVAALMRKVLADEKRDAEVRRKAVRVLEGAAGREAVPDFLARIGDSDAGVRELVTEAIFRLRDPAAVAPLLGLLGAPDAGVRRRVIKILGGLGGADARAALEKAARGDADAANRLAAVDALAALSGPEAEAGLVAATFDKEVEVRMAALRALVERSGLDTADPTVALDLARAAALVGVAARLARDANADVRRESVRVLGAAGGAEHEPVLREVSEKDGDFAVRVEAKRALERLRARAAKGKSS